MPNEQTEEQKEASVSRQLWTQRILWLLCLVMAILIVGRFIRFWFNL